MGLKDKTKKIMKSIFCLLVAVAYAGNMVVFSTGEMLSVSQITEECSENICLYSNELYVQANKKAILSKATEFDKENIEISDGVMSLFGDEYSSNEVLLVTGSVCSIKQPTYSSTNVSIYSECSEIDSIVVSENNINICGTCGGGSNAILYSKNGDININSQTVDMDGIIYAPNGNVKICVDKITFDGVIIAKKVEIYANELIIGNTNPKWMEKLSNIQTIRLTDFGMYYIEEKEKIIVEYEDDYKKVDLYYRYDNDKFECIENIGEELYLELPNNGGYLEGYIIAFDDIGNQFVTDVYSVYNDDGNCYRVARDSDEDGIEDGYEINVLGTEPYSKDTDNDGIEDSKDIYFDNLEYYDVRIDIEAEIYNQIVSANGTVFYLSEEESTDEIKSCYLKKTKLDIVSKGYIDENNLVTIVYDRISGREIFSFDDNGYELSLYDDDIKENRIAVLANGGEDDVVNLYKYDEENRLKAIYHNDFWYDLEYNKEKVSKIKIAGKDYISYEYDDAGNVISVEYNNGDRLFNSYDELGNILSVSDEKEVLYEWKYGKYYALNSYTDYVNGVTEKYQYDSDQELTRITNSDGTYIQYDYDIDETRLIVGTGNAQKISWSYEKENGNLCEYANLLSRELFYDEENKWVYSYDGNKIFEVTEKAVDNSIIKTIGNETYTYKFDSKGNLVEEYVNGELFNSYEYDGFGQMTRINSKMLDSSIIYEYDAGGNILFQKSYELAFGLETELLSREKEYISYGYDSIWKDLLVNYNGEEIVYDEVGNPLEYIEGIHMEWIDGRNLSKLTDKEGNISTYKYNSDGIRQSKCVNGEQITYLTNDSKLLYEKHDNYDIYYFYDETNKVQGFEYDDNTYFYVKNALDDIIGIIDTNGEWVVAYSYDAWGNVIDISGDEVLGKINPIRYKSYYYDEESGLYYLNSRYYDARTGRFINADKYIDTSVGIHSCNMFAYCENSPTTNTNSSGESWSSIVTVENRATAKSAYKIVKDKPDYNLLSRWAPDSMKYYNCYGYVINVTMGKLDSNGELIGMDPGYLSDKKLYYDLETIKTNVIADLKKMGYTRIKYGYSLASVEAYGAVIIAARIDNYQDMDYHFMKYAKSTKVWLHKPGQTAVLRYMADFDAYWACEYYNGGWEEDTRYTYTGDILYISYK